MHRTGLHIPDMRKLALVRHESPSGPAVAQLALTDKRGLCASRLPQTDAFHVLVSLPMYVICALTFLIYTLIVVLFAALYMLIDGEDSAVRISRGSLSNLGLLGVQ